METKMSETPNIVNGLNLDMLHEVLETVGSDPRAGAVEFHVDSTWQGQTLSRTTVESYTLGGEKIDRSFEITIDEPLELLGGNSHANPQEMLMAALNACMMVGYVANAALRGIRLDHLSITTRGELDLRGFLGIDPNVPAGYESLEYIVNIRGDGSAQDFREIHEAVQQTSPNYFNISRPIKLEAKLNVM